MSIKFPRTIAGTDSSSHGDGKVHRKHASCRVTLLQRQLRMSHYFTWTKETIILCAISFVTNRHIANERSNGVGSWLIARKI